MNRTIMKSWLTALLLFVFVIHTPVVTAIGYAGEDNTLTHYLGETVNTGKDNGYSGSEDIKEGDPHFGWRIGRFSVSGYTRVTQDDDGNPVFLKNPGDTVTLWFMLEQDINALNGDESLTIAEDKNGHDEYFGIEKTNFGHGALIIRTTDYQNYVSEPDIYTDYLAAVATLSANTEVQMFEEGDYEVALNYEIKDTPMEMFGVSIFPSYSNYRISFKFSVRNGDCMVYPHDVSTRLELVNTAFTENGFYLDLAKSRYLDIDIKKEILNEIDGELVEDVRFNRPAKDGNTYTDEGLYTITVSNHYTEQQTEKIIYVGTNDLLKAHATTGVDLPEIRTLISQGATISNDGHIVLPKDYLSETQEITGVLSQPNNQEQSSVVQSERMDWSLLFSLIGLFVVLVLVIHRVMVNLSRRKDTSYDEREVRK